MTEYITKDEVISLFEKWSDGYAYIEIPVQDAMKQVSAIPPADVRPVVRGHWEERIVEDREMDPVGLFRRRWYCSACGEWQTYGKTRYCPDCDAEMDGES